MSLGKHSSRYRACPTTLEVWQLRKKCSTCYSIPPRRHYPVLCTHWTNWAAHCMQMCTDKSHKKQHHTQAVSASGNKGGYVLLEWCHRLSAQDREKLQLDQKDLCLSLCRNGSMGILLQGLLSHSGRTSLYLLVIHPCEASLGWWQNHDRISWDCDGLTLDHTCREPKTPVSTPAL